MSLQNQTEYDIADLITTKNITTYPHIKRQLLNIYKILIININQNWITLDKILKNKQQFEKKILLFIICIEKYITLYKKITYTTSIKDKIHRAIKCYENSFLKIIHNKLPDFNTIKISSKNEFILDIFKLKFSSTNYGDPSSPIIYNYATCDFKINRDFYKFNSVYNKVVQYQKPINRNLIKLATATPFSYKHSCLTNVYQNINSNINQDNINKLIQFESFINQLQTKTINSLNSIIDELENSAEYKTLYLSHCLCK